MKRVGFDGMIEVCFASEGSERSVELAALGHLVFGASTCLLTRASGHIAVVTRHQACSTQLSKASIRGPGSECRQRQASGCSGLLLRFRFGLPAILEMVNVNGPKLTRTGYMNPSNQWYD